MLFELDQRTVASRPKVDGDVADGRKYLVTVVLVVVLGARLAGTQAEFEARQGDDEVPLDLQQRVALAGAERSEAHDRMLHLVVALVELGVDEAVVFENLRAENAATIKN